MEDALRAHREQQPLNPGPIAIVFCGWDGFFTNVPAIRIFLSKWADLDLTLYRNDPESQALIAYPADQLLEAIDHVLNSTPLPADAELEIDMVRIWSKIFELKDIIHKAADELRQITHKRNNVELPEIGPLWMHAQACRERKESDRKKRLRKRNRDRKRKAARRTWQSSGSLQTNEQIVTIDVTAIDTTAIDVPTIKPPPTIDATTIDTTAIDVPNIEPPPTIDATAINITAVDIPNIELPATIAPVAIEPVAIHPVTVHTWTHQVEEPSRSCPDFASSKRPRKRPRPIQEVELAFLWPGFQTHDPTKGELIQKSKSIRDQQRSIIKLRSAKAYHPVAIVQKTKGDQ